MNLPLADYLRALPDDRLAALVRLRPDLIVPVPADMSVLAMRAQSRLSVARALDGLDRFVLQILDALRFTRDDAGTTSVEAVLAMSTPAGIEPARVRAAIEDLRIRCIGYGPDERLHLVSTVDEVCSPYPAGLGRPAAELSEAAEALAADPAGLRRALLAAPPAARAVLDRLAAGPPVGTVSPTNLAPDSGSPVRWLVAASLLVPVADDTVELPREVGLLLRRDTGPLGPLQPDPPPLDTPARDQSAVDQAGAGQAMELVRHVEALLETLGTEPAGVLRSGGVGVRDLRRLAKAAGVDENPAGVLLEVASAAGLLGEATGEGGDAQYLPTGAYDAWRTYGIAARWTKLAVAWLTMTRAPTLIGQRDERDRLINALSLEVERPGAATQRRGALDVLLGLPPAATADPDDVVAVLAWRAPRRASRSSANWVASALAEAALLGLIGFGALTGYGRLLLEELLADPASGDHDEDPLGVRTGDAAPSATPPAGNAARNATPPAGDAARKANARRARARAGGPVEALDALLPSPVDHVLLQADLTMVVPGPAEPGLAAELAGVADAESPSVYRVTRESIRRALDAGYGAADLHALFARRSRTPVPQALRYLIDDVARRHGGLRVGAAGAYLRSEDEALVTEVLADRRLATLSLRRLAPTVLASPYSPARLLTAMREAGYSPVAEDATGAAVLARPKQRRAERRPTPPQRRIDDPLAMPRLGAARLAGVVEQIRHGDAAAAAGRRAPVTVRAVNGGAGPTVQAHTKALAVLQQAVRDRARVWVGYVDAHGSAASRLVRPVSMGGGYLRAEDERTDTLHTFALHRITVAVPEE